MATNLIFIKDWIVENIQDKTYEELYRAVGITAPMISNYRKGYFNPSLKTALMVYKYDGTVLHPFNEDSLKYELIKENLGE